MLEYDTVSLKLKDGKQTVKHILDFWERRASVARQCSSSCEIRQPSLDNEGQCLNRLWDMSSAQAQCQARAYANFVNLVETNVTLPLRSLLATLRQQKKDIEASLRQSTKLYKETEDALQKAELRLLRCRSEGSALEVRLSEYDGNSGAPVIATDPSPRGAFSRAVARFGLLLSSEPSHQFPSPSGVPLDPSSLTISIKPGLAFQ